MSKISNFSFSEAATNSLASHVTYALITGNPISGPFIAASACIASVAYLFKESNRFEPKLESAAKSLMLGVAQGALFGTMHKICFVVL